VNSDAAETPPLAGDLNTAQICGLCFVAFVILRWIWGKGMLPVGVGSGAAIASILIDLSRQVARIDQLDASLELTRPSENNRQNEVTVEAIENIDRE
jgi:hypothetical protein